MHGGRMTREQSFQVTLSVGEETKKTASDLETVKKNLAQAHFTIAELRVVSQEKKALWCCCVQLLFQNRLLQRRTSVARSFRTS